MGRHRHQGITEFLLQPGNLAARQQLRNIIGRCRTGAHLRRRRQLRFNHESSIAVGAVAGCFRLHDQCQLAFFAPGFQFQVHFHGGICRAEFGRGSRLRNLGRAIEQGNALDVQFVLSALVEHEKFVWPGVVKEIRGVGHVPDVGPRLDLLPAPAIGQHRLGGQVIDGQLADRPDAPEGIGIQRRDFALHVEALFLELRPAAVDEVFGNHDPLEALVVEHLVARVVEFPVDACQRFLEILVGQALRPARLRPLQAIARISADREPAQRAALVFGIVRADLVVDLQIAFVIARPVGEAHRVEPLA